MADLPRGVYELAVERPEKASQTLLNKISDCPFSGALYLRHRGGPQSHQMARGEAIHACFEELTNMAIEAGEVSVPPEVAKDVMQALLDERVDLAMSPAEHDACRIAAWNFGVNATIDPAATVCVETMLEVEVGGWKVRGKLDLAEIAGGEGYVRDYKTGLGYPTKEQHEQDFQQQFYGLLLLEGVPEGESVPLGRGLAGVHLNAVFPRITDDAGHWFTRHAYKDRGQVHDFRRTVESALAKLDHGLETGQWKASPGSHCQFCPASGECPIPTSERPTVIATPGQAAEVGERIIVLEDELSGLRKMAKGWVEEGEPIRVGDFEFALVAETSQTADKQAIRAALAGAGLDPDDFYKAKQSIRFKRRKVAA